MHLPASQMFLNQVLDRGLELAYWYECIARCTGEYRFGRPFPELCLGDIERFAAKVQVEPVEGNMSGLVMHPYEAERREFDIWMRGPQFNVKTGGYFTDPFVCVFNLKLPTSVILNELSVEIFSEQKGQRPMKKQVGLKRVVKRLGKRNSLVSNLRESSVSLATIAPYFAANAEHWISPDTAARLATLKRDIKSLDEYISQLGSEIAFLLDSTVGLINFEQNQVMKWLGAAAILVTFV